MKTNPIRRADGSLLAFETPPSFFTQWPLTRLLRSIEGVSDVKAPLLSAETRLTFSFHGEPCVVKEDSDRYWIGPANAEASKLDLAPLHVAFQAHRNTALWRALSDFDTYHYAGMDPAIAYAVAVAASFAYFSLPDALLGAAASVVSAPAVLALPVAACGLLHFRVVRNSGMPKLGRWVQIFSSALLSPYVGWLIARAAWT